MLDFWMLIKSIFHEESSLLRGELVRCVYEKNKIEILERFINRTSMQIVPINELSIMSWIHGFEEGSGSKLFSQTLKEYIMVTYEL